MSTLEAVTKVDPIVFRDEVETQTYFDLIRAEKMDADEIATMCVDDYDVAPFDEAYSDGGCEEVIWRKALRASSHASLNRPVFISFLKDLMPEMDGFRRTFSNPNGNVEMTWYTDGARDITLGEQVKLLSPTTVALVTGTLTLDQLSAQLFTPANEALITSLLDNMAISHSGENLLTVIRDEVPAVLADGLL